MIWGGADVIIVEIKCTNKCNMLKSSWNPPPPSVEKLSSTKLVPGAEKVGDCWSRWSQHHPPLSLGWLLLWERWAECTSQGQGRGEEPLIVWVQLNAQLAVMASHWPLSTMWAVCRFLLLMLLQIFFMSFGHILSVYTGCLCLTVADAAKQFSKGLISFFTPSSSVWEFSALHSTPLSTHAIFSFNNGTAQTI